VLVDDDDEEEFVNEDEADREEAAES